MRLWAERKRWAWRADLNCCICRSRRRAGWCGYLGPVVEGAALPMLDTGQAFTPGSTMVAQVGGEYLSPIGAAGGLYDTVPVRTLG